MSIAKRNSEVISKNLPRKSVKVCESLLVFLSHRIKDSFPRILK